MATVDDQIEALLRSMKYEDAFQLALKEKRFVRAFQIASEGALKDSLLLASQKIIALPGASRTEACNKARAVAIKRSDTLAEGVLLEAMEEYEESYAILSSSEHWLDAARVAQKLNSPQKIGKSLEAHLQHHPDDLTAAIALSELLLSLRKPEKALRVINNVHPPDPTSQKRVAELRDECFSQMDLQEQTEPNRRAPVVAEEPKDDAPQKLFGRYEVLREVASTPSSRVLEAIDVLSAGTVRVALKIFTGVHHIGHGRDALDRFKREMRILSTLRSSVVVKPLEFLPEGPTIVFPWFSGGNLTDQLRAHEFTAKRASEIIARVLEALDDAHRRGVIHRDIKPSNILLDEAGGAYLTDFGVAHLNDSSTTATVGTHGTFAYMAPELKRGEAATVQSDIYAVGLVFRELLGIPSDQVSDDGMMTMPPLTRAMRHLLATWSAPSREWRPAAAEIALDALGAIHWPDEVLLWPNHPRSQKFSSDSITLSEGSRFIDEDEGSFDTWLLRRVIKIRANDPRTAYIQATVRTLDNMFAELLGTDHGSQTYLVEQPRGEVSNELSAVELERVRLAITRLHGEGLAHGDLLHCITRTSTGLVLQVPPLESLKKRATPHDDLRALRSLQPRKH